VIRSAFGAKIGGECIGVSAATREDDPAGDYAPGMQRRALGLLFGVLAAVFVATAVAAVVGAGGAKGWVVAVGALALGAWLGSLAVSAFRGS
jgi:hypothetical protein